MTMTTTDFELQQARMAVVHAGRDDLLVAKAALLSRSDILLNDRKGLLADMRDFVEFARADVRPARFIRPKTAALAVVFGMLLIGVAPIPAAAQVTTNSSNAVDPRTTAYQDCHRHSTEMLYQEHPTCQPGAARLQSPSSTAPCPFGGGDRLSEIMRRSAECMRSKGY